MPISPYINFDGNCAQAFAFYAELMDGELGQIMKFSDGPDDMPVPEGAADKVMHGEVMVAGTVIMGTDAVTMPYAKPAGVSISLQLDDIVEVERIFKGLAAEGVVGMPMEQTFFAERFGTVTDKYGVSWQVMAIPPE